jgi:hypothetical protein
MAAPLELEEIVRAQLQPEIHELVARLVPELVGQELEQLAQGNGAQTVRSHAQRAQGTTRAVAAAADTSAKVCNAWRVEKPLGQYDKGRGTCRQCRQQQQRDREHRRAATDQGDSPRPDQTA